MHTIVCRAITRHTKRDQHVRHEKGNDMTDRPPKVSAAAIVSCALGLVGVILPFSQQGVEEFFLLLLVCPIAPLVFGFVSLRRINQNAGMKGRGLAFTGIILGCGMVALFITFAGLRLRAVNHFQLCGDNIELIEDDLSPGDRLPVCPGGGTYTYTVTTNGLYRYVQCCKHGGIASCRMGI